MPTRLSTRQLSGIWRAQACGGKSKALARRLGLAVETVTAVRQALAELGIGRRPRKVFSQVEREIVRRDYRNVPTAELAARLQTTVGRLYQLAGRLGIAKNALAPGVEPKKEAS